MVSLTDDTPDLIRHIAENRHYLLFCAVIVKSDQNFKFNALQKAIAVESRRQGISHEHLTKKLMPAAAALGLNVNDAGLAQADYYQILGVRPSDGIETIKKIYRSKARQLHPDSETGDSGQFISVQNAYSVLSDKNLRQQYDRSRKQARNRNWSEGQGKPTRPANLPNTTKRFTLVMASIIGLLVGIAWIVGVIDQEISLENGFEKSMVYAIGPAVSMPTGSPEKTEPMMMAAKEEAGNRETPGKALGDETKRVIFDSQALIPPPEKQPLEEKAVKRDAGATIKNALQKSREEILTQAVLPNVKKTAAQAAAVPEPAVPERDADAVVEVAAADQIAAPVQAELAKMPERIRMFLDNYCRTYESKDLGKFMQFFTDTALENGTTVQSLLPVYRRNFEVLDSIAYEISFADYTIDLDSRQLRVEGKFKLDWRMRGEDNLHQHNGRIKMDLLYDSGYDFRVDRLVYEFLN